MKVYVQWRELQIFVCIRNECNKCCLVGNTAIAGKYNKLLEVSIIFKATLYKMKNKYLFTMSFRRVKRGKDHL